MSKIRPFNLKNISAFVLVSFLKNLFLILQLKRRSHFRTFDIKRNENHAFLFKKLLAQWPTKTRPDEPFCRDEILLFVVNGRIFVRHFSIEPPLNTWPSDLIVQRQHAPAHHYSTRNGKKSVSDPRDLVTDRPHLVANCNHYGARRFLSGIRFNNRALLTK